MADSTIGAIDRLFDLVDSGVEKLDLVLNRGKQTEEQHHARHAKKAPQVIDTVSTVKVAKTPAAKTAPSSSTALSTAKRFRIVESIVPETGIMIFVVTNGHERAECATRLLAEKILRALEAQ